MSTQNENDVSTDSGMNQKEKKYNVKDVREYVDLFFDSFFSQKPSRYLKISRDGDNWNVVVELYEDSSIRDKNRNVDNFINWVESHIGAVSVISNSKSNKNNKINKKISVLGVHGDGDGKKAAVSFVVFCSSSPLSATLSSLAHSPLPSTP